MVYISMSVHIKFTVEHSVSAQFYVHTLARVASSEIKAPKKGTRDADKHTVKTEWCFDQEVVTSVVEQ